MGPGLGSAWSLAVLVDTGISCNNTQWIDRVSEYATISDNVVTDIIPSSLMMGDIISDVGLWLIHHNNVEVQKEAVWSGIIQHDRSNEV